MSDTPPERFALYRRTARALNAFFERFTSPHCRGCLDVTRGYHRADPRADVDLVDGVFPGCCHAGVGDALWVPRSGEEGRFSPELAEEMVRARAALGPPPDRPMEYSVKERPTGRMARGVACLQLTAGGCRLGELKGPLCIAYVCEPVRASLQAAAGPDLIGSDTDDFCGALAALTAAVAGDLATATREIEALEARLCALSLRLASQP